MNKLPDNWFWGLVWAGIVAVTLTLMFGLPAMLPQRTEPYDFESLPCVVTVFDDNGNIAFRTLADSVRFAYAEKPFVAYNHGRAVVMHAAVVTVEPIIGGGKP